MTYYIAFPFLLFYILNDQLDRLSRLRQIPHRITKHHTLDKQLWRFFSCLVPESFSYINQVLRLRYQDDPFPEVHPRGVDLYGVFNLARGQP